MSLVSNDREPISHSIEEFCAITGMKRSGVFNAIKRGEIEVAKYGRRTLIPRSSALEWLERVTVKRTAA
jgi:excisionase family DNA binding protein